MHSRFGETFGILTSMYTYWLVSGASIMGRAFGCGVSLVIIVFIGQGRYLSSLFGNVESIIRCGIRCPPRFILCRNEHVGLAHPSDPSLLRCRERKTSSQVN